MPAEGLCLRVTHTGLAQTSIPLSDVKDGVDTKGSFRKAGPVYVPQNDSVELVYSGDVAISFEVGAIRTYIEIGHLTAEFIIGTALADLFASILDEGVLLTPTPTQIDFVGAGVTATTVGDLVTVTIPGGAGGGDHTGLSNLAWSSSDHTGTISTFAAFTGAGAATNLSTTASGGDVGGTWPSLTVTDFTFAGQAQGDTLYFNGTDWVRLAAGTSGQFLQTSGAAANPVWATPSGAGTLDHAALTSNLAWATSDHTGTVSTFAAFTGAGVATNLSTTASGGDVGGVWPSLTVTDFTISGEAQGDVLYFDGTNWVRLAPGTAGQFLQTSGAAANPVWATPSGAGTLDHAALTSNLAWSTSGHTGTVSTFAAFTAAGATTNLSTTASGGDVGGTWPALTVTDFTISGEAQGDVLYFNGTNWVRLAPGTSGQFLQTSGAAANPVWATAAGGGGTLQTAYDAGNSIVTATSTAILFTLTSGGFTVDGTGTINMGADATAQALNFGTGAAAKTVAIGSTTGASQTDLAAGTGNVNTTTAMAWNGVISPTSLAADANDYTPTGLAGVSVIRQESSVDVTITGITGGVSGRILVLTNIGSNTITLTDEDAASTAANRFLFGDFVRLFPEDSIILQYDATSARWRTPATSRGTVSGAVKTVFTQFGSNASVALGEHNTVTVGSNGAINLETRIPPDFNTLISIAAVMFPGSTNAVADIDLDSTYCTSGEVFNANVESDATLTFNLTLELLTLIDASSVAVGIAANDFIGIKFKHNATGGTSNYLGMVLTYT